MSWQRHMIGSQERYR